MKHVKLSEFNLEAEGRLHQRAVYVDIDDTLLLHQDFTRSPVLNKELYAKLLVLKEAGVQLVAWTGNARGFDGAWARRRELAAVGIDLNIFTAILAKPHVIIDDKPNWFDDTFMVEVGK